MKLNRLWILLLIGILGCSATQNAPKNPTCEDQQCEVWVHTSKGPGARIAYGKTADMNCETPWLFDRGDISPCRIPVEEIGYYFVSLREKKNGEWEITGMYESLPFEGIQKFTIIELMDSCFLSIPENSEPEND